MWTAEALNGAGFSAGAALDLKKGKRHFSELPDFTSTRTYYCCAAEAHLYMS